MDKIDFRAAAAAESAALVGTSPAGQVTTSCCIPRDADGSALRRRIEVFTIFACIVAIAGVILGGLVGFAMKYGWMAEDLRILGIALACSVGGILVGLAPTWMQEGVVRRHLTKHVGELWGDPLHSPLHVALEDARTYDRFKVLAEDIGVLLCYPESNCIAVEGVSYRYVIYAKDLLDMKLHPNGRAVLLAYQIGRETLNVAIIRRSVRAELKRQLSGGTALFDEIKMALAQADVWR